MLFRSRVTRAALVLGHKFLQNSLQSQLSPIKRGSGGVRRNLGESCEGPSLQRHEELSCWLSCSPDLHPECPSWSCQTYGAVPLPSLVQAGSRSKGSPPSSFLSLFFLGGSDVAKFCCFQYSHKILPWKSVHSYKFTRNSCSQQAVM